MATVSDHSANKMKLTSSSSRHIDLPGRFEIAVYFYFSYCIILTELTTVRAGHVGLPVSTISTKKGCGGVELGTGGVIESPNFPGSFPKTIDCVWTIRVRQDQHIYIKVMQLQLFGSIGNILGPSLATTQSNH